MTVAVSKNQDGERVEVSPTVTVGFAFMPKKVDSMTKVFSCGPCDGVDFCQLDFSCRPDQHKPLDIIIHKLSDDIMFRGSRPEGNARLKWMEQYKKEYPDTVLVDPIEKVANVINRVTTLELLKNAYKKHGAAGGMPRPPRFVVYEDRKGPDGQSPWSSLAFPVICKPIEACGTRGSHTMVVVLDQASMGNLKLPVVVQEYRNHGGKLFKVCVIGDEVRVHERPSLPDLPPGLVGSFAFDSQKAYPKLAEIGAISEAITRIRGPSRAPLKKRKSGDATNAPPPPPSLESRYDRIAGSLPSTMKAGTAREMAPPTPSLSLEAAKVAAVRMRETFGLTIFGFDLIVDTASGEAMVIDVNYFPSFKDLGDFPQVLRRRLRDMAVAARLDINGETGEKLDSRIFPEISPHDPR